MDLTAAIRFKIDRLRSAKTARYNALSSAIEQEVAILTQRSAELFTKLEDALEASVLGNSTDTEKFKTLKEQEVKKEGDVVEEDGEADEKVMTDESSIKEPIQDLYDIEEEKDVYDDHESEVPANTNIPVTNDVVVATTRAPTFHVSGLRSRAQETQTQLAEKHASLTILRQKHDIAMKRLDKLQFDLEKVSQKWEAEERRRIQTESTSALGKRKREDQDDDGEGPRKTWKRLGIKGVEWGVLFGIGVVSAVGLNKLQH
jgi:hypothetical protein